MGGGVRGGGTKIWLRGIFLGGRGMSKFLAGWGGGNWTFPMKVCSNFLTCVIFLFFFSNICTNKIYFRNIGQPQLSNWGHLDR